MPYIKGYSYLNELRKRIPEYAFIDLQDPGTYGYAAGTRYEDDPQARAVYINAQLSPREEEDTRRHEYMHQAVDLSPNWSHIVQTQKPTAELDKVVKEYYPRDYQVEENMIRHLGSRVPGNMTWRNVAGGLSPIQQKLLTYLKNHAEYGPQWGSFWGPEYDERELRQGKGQNILPKFVLKPESENMGVAPRPKKQEPTLSERIGLEAQNGYDLWGYMQKYGLPKGYLAGTGEHLTDEFKLPNHITFSTDSKYSTPKTPGGTWAQDADRRWHYRPSDYVLSVHPREELREYFEKHEPNSTLDLPTEEDTDRTTRPMYDNAAPPAWSELY